MSDPQHPTRRRFLIAGTLAATGLSLNVNVFAQGLSPTPTCQDGDQPTMRQTEGPFYKSGSPARADLVESGMPGQPIEISGFVLTRSCRPVAGAVVDFWQADHAGDYDNKGFRLRGHQITDAEGRYRLRTIAPGAYAGRTPHIHVKVQPRGGSVLTTQLYFPGEAKNRSDGLFRRELVIRTAKTDGGLAGRFDFVLDMR